MIVQCPFCDSTDCFSNGSINQVYGGDEKIYVPMYCDNCNKSFNAVFKLLGNWGEDD